MRPQPVQEPLSRCERAFVNCHCGGASNFSLSSRHFFFWEVFQLVHLFFLRGGGIGQFEHRNKISSDCHQFPEVLSPLVDGLARCWNFLFRSL